MSLHSDLILLQGKVKEDPEIYREDAMKHFKHFLTQYEIYQLKPSKEHKEFSSLVKFLSAIAACYPEELKDFPSQIAGLLEQNSLILEPGLRIILVRSLILLRNKNLLSPTSLLSLFFKLFRCPDKTLRHLLRKHIVLDIEKCNKKKKNTQLNKTLQNFMYTMLRDASQQASRESLAVMIELWRKRVWNDDKTVNVISSGIFSPDSKLIAMVLDFFLSPDGRIEDEEEEKKIMSKREINKKYGNQFSKQRRSKDKKLDQKLKENKKIMEDKKNKEKIEIKQYNSLAISNINDPQTYCEKVFNLMKSSNHGYDLKIKLMNFISRLISSNKLMIDSFYSYMQKYVQPHIQNITLILAIVAQSVHDLVTPDIVEPLIYHIANNFVVDRRPPEVIAIGLNTIREICMRSPLAMPETLLKDLIQYKTHRDKGVAIASKSILVLFRILNPKMLPRKDRGKDADMNKVLKKFGEKEVIKGITGTELLEKYGSRIDLNNPDDSFSISDDDSEQWKYGYEYENETLEDGQMVPEAEDNARADRNKKHLRAPVQEMASESGEDDWEVVGSSDQSSNKNNNTNSEIEEIESEGGQFGDSDSGVEDSDDVEIEFGSGDEFDEIDDFGEAGESGADASDEEDSETDDEDDDSEEEEESGDEDSESTSSSDSQEVRKARSEDGDRSLSEMSSSTFDPTKPRLETVRILTEEDWQKLKIINEKLSQKKKKKRKLPVENPMEEADGDVDENALIGARKKQKTTYQERVEQNRENKTDVSGYSKFNKVRAQHSVTNEQKKFTKPFLMVKHKHKGKQNRKQMVKKQLVTKHLKKRKSQSMSKHF